MASALGTAGSGLNAAATVASAIPGGYGSNTKPLNTAAGVTSFTATGIATLGSLISVLPAALTPAIAGLAAAGPWAAAVAGALILVSKIFHGADPQQVPAAQVQQAFEAAAKNFYALAKKGMITKAEATAGIQVLLNKGVEYYRQVPQHAGAMEHGVPIMTNTINTQISLVAGLPDSTKTVPIDLTVARASYIPKQPGWYDVSLDAANSLTDDFLRSVLADRAAAETAAKTTVEAVISAETITAVAKSPLKLAGVGLGAFAVVAAIRHFL